MLLPVSVGCPARCLLRVFLEPSVRIAGALVAVLWAAVSPKTVT